MKWFFVMLFVILVFIQVDAGVEFRRRVAAEQQLDTCVQTREK